METRIVKLYQRLDKGVMPWQWDYDNYSGNNSDMIGFFYSEDINAVDQIRELEIAGEQRRVDEQQRSSKK